MNISNLKKSKQFIKYRGLFIVILLLGACTDSKDGTNGMDESSVTITISGVTDDGQNLRNALAPDLSVQTFVVPYDDNMVIYASLEPENKSITDRSGTTRATEITPLDNGIKYSVVVYDNNGNFVSKTDYTYDSSSQTHGSIKNLNQGEAYTFIVYSVNSTSSLPSITNRNNLSTARLSGISEDLMFFKQAVTIQPGVNNINVTLKHKFSLITSKLSVDPDIRGTITSFTPPVIKPARISADISFANESLTYNNEKTAGAEVSFGSLGTGVGSITSTPTLVINPTTSSGTYEIGSITVNNSTNSVVLQNVKINPGYKYNLNLNFKIPCTQNVGTNGVFDVDASSDPQTVLAPAANYGFVFDIYYLDNSFNMEINGTKLATTELQFQRNDKTLPENVKFADGSYWEDGTVPAIWNLNPVGANYVPLPVIRVVISKDGAVSMYGVKKNPKVDPTLYPLALDTDKTQFNTITWNSSEQNTVIITQYPIPPTRMIGYGYGKQIIPCQ